MDSKTLDKLAYLLVVAGGLNYAWMAVFEKDLILNVLDDYDLARVVYGVIGLGAVYLTYWLLVRQTKKSKK